ncbi:hypothetical protein ACTFIR_003584 [Dictyostelium discoideum]
MVQKNLYNKIRVEKSENPKNDRNELDLSVLKKINKVKSYKSKLEEQVVESIISTFLNNLVTYKNNAIKLRELKSKLFKEIPVFLDFINLGGIPLMGNCVKCGTKLPIVNRVLCSSCYLYMPTFRNNFRKRNDLMILKNTVEIQEMIMDKQEEQKKLLEAQEYSSGDPGDLILNYD